MTSRIVSTGSYRPSHVVKNTDFENILDTSDAWIRQRTGIEERRFESKSNATMALRASEAALKDIDINKIDCIIAATYTPDAFIPSLASQLRAELKIERPIPAFDVNAACTGFLVAYQIAHAYLVSGLYNCILVVGSDLNSRTLDFTDRSTAILFGDGAGAVVMERGERGTIDCMLGGEIDHSLSLQVKNMTDHPNPFIKREQEVKQSYFEMNGADVFKFAIRSIEYCIRNLAEKNGLDLNEIDYVISHQANQRILDYASRSLKMDKSKFLMNLNELGNTSAGSVPLLLDEENRKGTFKKGMKLILVAFGGGLSYGCALIEWDR